MKILVWFFIFFLLLFFFSKWSVSSSFLHAHTTVWYSGRPWSCPVSHSKQTLLEQQSPGNSMVSIQYIHYIYLKYLCHSHCIVQYVEFAFFLATGQNLSKSPQSPGMAKVKKGGLYLSISPVTTGHEGVYVCSMTKNDMELINSYNIEVDGEK